MHGWQAGDLAGSVGRRTLVHAMALALVLPQARRGWASEHGAPESERPLSPSGAMEWATGPRDGDWFSIANGLVTLMQDENLGVAMRVVPGIGSVNPTRVQMETSKLALCWDFLAYAAFRGEAPYQLPHDKLRSLGHGYTATRHYLVAASGCGPDDLPSILSYRQARIGIPVRNSVEDMAWRRILAFYNTQPEALHAAGLRFRTGSHDDLIAAWNDRRVDYLYLAPFRNMQILEEISQGCRAARLVSFPPEVIAHLAGFSSQCIAKDTYPALQSADVLVPACESTLLVADTFPEETAYRLVQCLVRNAGARLGRIHPALLAFTPAEAARDPVVPLHPGAARALAEGGSAPPVPA